MCNSSLTLAHSHHPRGPILTLRPTVQGWEGTDLILEWGAERGGSGVEFLMDIHLQVQRVNLQGVTGGDGIFAWYIRVVIGVCL